MKLYGNCKTIATAMITNDLIKATGQERYRRSSRKMDADDDTNTPREESLDRLVPHEDQKDEDFGERFDEETSGGTQPRPPGEGALQPHPPPPGSRKFPSQPQVPVGELNGSDDEPDDEDSYDSEIAGQNGGGYDPNDFVNLPISTEIKELFSFITAYSPAVVDLDTKLKVFIPELIPAVGDIDPFIKVPRPDEVEDNLGLVQLDEPSANQSDSTVFDLQLRAISKSAPPPSETVMKRVDRTERSTKEIENWIKSIGELHRSKPATVVHYTKPMPDIDQLMQEWPPELEELLKQVELPSANLDCSLEQYVDLICSVLDIPIYKSRIQALHVLFTLYSEFKNSQHFKQLADRNDMENSPTRTAGQTDQLIL